MSSSERPSAEPILKKRGVPSRTAGQIILEMLWKPQMPWGLGYPSRTLEGNSRKRSESVSGVFPEFFKEFLPENPSRTEGMAQLCSVVQP